MCFRYQIDEKNYTELNFVDFIVETAIEYLFFDKVNNKLPFGLKSEIFDKVNKINSFELCSIDELKTNYANFSVEAIS